MKKSATHLIVLSLTAVFALSACERRQRPTPEKTKVAQETAAKKAEADKTAKLNEAKKTIGENAKAEADKAAANGKTNGTSTTLEGDEVKTLNVDALTQKAFAEKDQALGKQIELLTAEKVGVMVARDDKQALIAKFDRPTYEAAIKEKVNNAPAKADGSPVKEDELGVAIHGITVKTFEAANDITKSYVKNENELNEVKDVSKEDVKRAVADAKAVKAMIIELDAFLDSAYSQKHDALK